MSIKVMSWVWDNSPYKDDALLIHLALADWANDDGICWPNQKSIAAKARCSVEHVRRVTRKMQSDGFIEIVSASKGPGSSHTYQLKRPTNSGAFVRQTPHIGEAIPHIEAPNTPHPVGSNRQEPSRTTTCPYCKAKHSGTHYCPPMNQRI